MADPNRPQDPTSTQLVHSYHGATGAGLGDDREPGEAGDLDERLFTIIREANREASTYVANSTRNAWQKSYRAYRNQHWSSSKYLTKRWEARSKIFRPKTRAAVRKGDATAASALFATPDIVSIQPQNESDKLQQASAAVKQQLLEYRLDRVNDRNGIPWFLISMGARQDAQITGVCCSKQSWVFEARMVTEQVEEPAGVEFDEEMGQFRIVTKMREVEREEKVKNRPDIQLFPPENVLVDPAAPWVNPAQLGAYLILRTPMHADEVKAWVRRERENELSALEFLDFDEKILRKESNENSDAKAIRHAREAGRDRYDEISVDVEGLNIVWVHENFVRLEGQDYHFWSVTDQHRLTKSAPVEDVYPEQNGDRPVTWGYGTLESHRIYPMSMVESIQELQKESNDVVNLRLDGTKNSISPPTKVRRGKRVDLKQVQNRGPDTVLQLDDVDDVQWDHIPFRPQEAFQAEDRLSLDIDDLTGTFSGSSVQSNRKLNETVGGMNMLQGHANAITEFDLRVWVETWAEPTLRQIVRLEEYYENDPIALAVAGGKAKLMQKFGMDEVTDDLLNAEVTTRINVGLGGMDPTIQLQKLERGLTMLANIMGDKFQATINMGEVVAEVMGKLGHKDSERFFDIEKLEAAREGPPPEVAELAAQIQELKRQIEAGIAKEQARGEVNMQIEDKKAAARSEEQKRELRTDLAKTLLSQQHEIEQGEVSAVREQERQISDSILGTGNGGPERVRRVADRRRSRAAA